MHCATATWLADWIILWMSRCTGVSNKVASEWICSAFITLYTLITNRFIIQWWGGGLAAHFSGCFSSFFLKGWVCHSRVTFWNCLESGQINKRAKSQQERHNMPSTAAWTCYLKKRSKSLSESDHFDRTFALSASVISPSFLDDREWLLPLVI